MSSWFPMAAFALVSSITPGPVNLVALGAGARHGFARSLRHVTGATLGFTLLLLVAGLGLAGLVARVPALLQALRWAGFGFLGWMAWRLATDDGRLGEAPTARAPSFMVGAAMQWLNPKAWLASLAGLAVFGTGGDARTLGGFAAIWFAVCWASIACWAGAGAALRARLREPRHVRAFNRAMAALVAASAAGLLA